MNAKAEVTGGSVTNVIQVARQESDLGIAMADVVSSAYAGKGRFPEPFRCGCSLPPIPTLCICFSLRDSGITEH